MGVTDESNQDRMLVFKYHKNEGKLELSTLDGDRIISRILLAPEKTCKVIADYLDSVRAYDAGAHPEHAHAEENDNE